MMKLASLQPGCTSCATALDRLILGLARTVETRARAFDCDARSRPRVPERHKRKRPTAAYRREMLRDVAKRKTATRSAVAELDGGRVQGGAHVSSGLCRCTITVASTVSLGCRKPVFFIITKMWICNTCVLDLQQLTGICNSSAFRNYCTLVRFRVVHLSQELPDWHGLNTRNNHLEEPEKKTYLARPRQVPQAEGTHGQHSRIATATEPVKQVLLGLNGSLEAQYGHGLAAFPAACGEAALHSSEPPRQAPRWLRAACIQNLDAKETLLETSTEQPKRVMLHMGSVGWQKQRWLWCAPNPLELVATRGLDCVLRWVDVATAGRSRISTTSFARVVHTPQRILSWHTPEMVLNYFGGYPYIESKTDAGPELMLQRVGTSALIGNISETAKANQWFQASKKWREFQPCLFRLVHVDQHGKADGMVGRCGELAVGPLLVQGKTLTRRPYKVQASMEARRQRMPKCWPQSVKHHWERATRPSDPARGVAASNWHNQEFVAGENALHVFANVQGIWCSAVSFRQSAA